MGTAKKYFNDRIVLLLLSTNAFLTILSGILLLLKLDTSRGTGYIVEFRPNLGLERFKSGSVSELLSFVAFALLMLVMNTILSYKVYHVRRHFSIAILALTLLLLILTLIIIDALLTL